MDDTIATAAEAFENDAFPRRREVHTETTAEADPLPEAVATTPVKRKSPAEWAYERLILYIQNFEKQLDDEQEIAMAMTGSGAGVMRIEGMGFFDPDIVTFYGRDESGARAQLIQHVTQLSVVLRALPIATPAAPPRRIGFRLAQDLDAKADQSA